MSTVQDVTNTPERQKRRHVDESVFGKQREPSQEARNVVGDAETSCNTCCFDDTTIVIPSPNKEILRMSPHAICWNLVKEIVEPCATSLFTYLLKEGFIQPLTSQFYHKVSCHPEDLRTTTRFEALGRDTLRLTSSLAVVYVILNTSSGKIQKVGSSKSAMNQETFSKEAGSLQPNQAMYEIFNFDLITHAADQTAQNEYYKMMNMLVTHKACPKPLQHVLISHLHRGGDAFFKKTTILQMVEYGAKHYFGCTIRDFKFLMFDARNYQSPANEIQIAWNCI